jgi:hypothetical protein
MTESTFTPNARVVASIQEAVKTSATVYASLREAAQFAAPELDLSKALGESVREVRNNYSEYFAGDHNLQAVFTDLLTLHYAADSAVSFERKRGKEVEEVHTTAEQAVQMSKHDMRKAAKEVRENEGEGRKSGGGRKPRTPEAKSGTTKNLTTSAASAIENLLKSEAGIQALRELLKANGYQLRKVAK